MTSNSRDQVAERQEGVVILCFEQSEDAVMHDVFCQHVKLEKFTNEPDVAIELQSPQFHVV